MLTRPLHRASARLLVDKVATAMVLKVDAVVTAMVLKVVAVVEAMVVTSTINLL